MPEIKIQQRIFEDFHEVFKPLISRDKPLVSAFSVGELELFSKSSYHFRRGRYDFRMPEMSNYWINHQEFRESLRKITNLSHNYLRIGNNIQLFSYRHLE